MGKGKYIVIEGHDGTGKSTQVGILRQKLLENGIESIEFHEPAGSPVADAIRTVIKNGDLERDAMTNLLLFSASRHELWTQRAASELKLGHWVITARSYYSSLAFQGYGEGLDLNIINDVTKIATGEDYMNPDLALILSMDNEDERARRIAIRGELEQPDTFESKDKAFQRRVREGYLQIAHDKNVPVISAAQPIDRVTDDIWAHVEKLL